MPSIRADGVDVAIGTRANLPSLIWFTPQNMPHSSRLPPCWGDRRGTWRQHEWFRRGHTLQLPAEARSTAPCRATAYWRAPANTYDDIRSIYLYFFCTRSRHDGADVTTNMRTELHTMRFFDRFAARRDGGERAFSTMMHRADYAHHAAAGRNIHIESLRFCQQADSRPAKSPASGRRALSECLTVHQ